MKYLLLLFSLVFLVSCSSTNGTVKTTGSSYKKERGFDKKKSKGWQEYYEVKKPKNKNNFMKR